MSWSAKLTSPVMLAAGVYRRRWAQAAARAPLTVVLVYHRVSVFDSAATGRFTIEKGIDARVFERQMRFMLKHFTAIQCSQALAPERAPLSFAVSFDDGYDDNYRVAAPILRRLGVPATFFVISDFVGTDRLFWWEQLAALIRATRSSSFDPAAISSALAASLGTPARVSLASHAHREAAYEALCKAIRSGPGEAIGAIIAGLAEMLQVRPRECGRDDELMDWTALRTLSQQGFEIGGHTASHCNVPAAAAATLAEEIVGSARVIEDQLQQPVLSFAYPYGFHDPARTDIVALLKSTNCRVAFTGRKGVATASASPYALPRARLNRAFGFACAYNVDDALQASAISAPAPG